MTALRQHRIPGPKRKTLFVHNYYQQPGGEDQAFEAEARLLADHDHQVIRYTVHNDQLAGMSPLHMSKATVWNTTLQKKLRALIRQERPRMVHFHNTFPLISPAAYHAARAEAVPVVQTLHNYRLLCPNALFFRDGRVCEDCLGKKVPWPGVLHACYRESRPASGVVASMLAAHRALDTWSKADLYIALTEFAREKFVQGGLPEDQVVTKPNFLHPDPGPGSGRGDYALFVGRLSTEKGVDTLLRAWELFSEVPLKVVGDGPLAARVSEAAGRLDGVEWLGRQPKDRVLDLMKDARFLVFPSVWYEGFPMVLVEALAVGLPVIAGDLGSMSSIVDHGRTGFRFRAGDPEELAAWVERASTDSEELARMRQEARATFEAEYTAEENYRRLTEIYDLAAERAEARA